MSAAKTQFQNEDGWLMISGQKVADIAAELDQPAYLYSAALIEERVQATRQALGPDVQLHYAVKANPFPPVVKLLNELCDGLDVASQAELELALGQGADASHMSFAGPGKRDVELHAAIEAGVLLNLESHGEAGRAASIAAALGTIARVAIRINPDFEVRGSGMQMGGGAKPFGVDAEQVPDLVDWIEAQQSLQFVGFHIYSGSQVLNSEILSQLQQQSLDLADRLAAGRALQHLNIGGGFGIPYFPGDAPLDLSLVGERLRAALAGFRAKHSSCAVVVELGRFLVGEAGVYVCRVVDRKVSRGQTYLICDGGLHHHLALSGNFGQVIRKNYPLEIDGKIGAPAQETVSIAGPLCTPLDRLGDNMALPAAEPGDLVIIFQSGAYGASASPVHFLSHPHPVERLL